MHKLINRVPALQKHVVYLLQEATRIASVRADEALSKFSLNIREYFVLVVVDGKSFSQQSIADSLHINRNSMVTLCDELENKGFVNRRRNPENRREQFIELTEKGSKTLSTVMKEVIPVKSIVFPPLSKSELETLSTVLSKYIKES
jgi:DNA-binding MarR family transcriptional regulator